jgi:putative tryptophan/tyrosine transport system substrate-binding protein
MPGMRRREFITLLGGASAAWPLAAWAQQPTKLPTIGFLGTGSRSSWGSWADAFVERLRELGWIEGRTVAIEYRWAEGRRSRFAEIAAEFVRLKVDVIVTSGAAGIEVKRAAPTIPIILGVANDPVGEGLVTSLARPGGNVTGLSLQASDIAGKRLGLLREVLPDFRRLAVLADVGYPAGVLEMREAQTTARTLGLEVVTLEIRQAEDIGPAFETHKGDADALFVGPLTTTNQVRINTLALAARLPTISVIRENAEAGALMSYGPHFPSLFRRAAEYVDKVLRGAKPAEIPVEQPTKFELVINLKTAKALGVEVPATLLARADEVIE